MRAWSGCFGWLWLLGCAGPQRSTEVELPVEGGVPGVHQSNFLFGVRELEDSGFGDLDDQLLLGVDFCQPIGFERVRLEGGLHTSFGESDDRLPGGHSVDLSSATFEVSGGLNAFWPLGHFQPYVGLGGSLLFIDLEGFDLVDDVHFHENEFTGGGYLKTGVLFHISGHSHIGLEYRHLETGSISLEGEDLDAGYDQFALLFGANW